MVDTRALRAREVKPSCQFESGPRHMIKKQQGSIEYFIKGDKPILLVLSGMHGDEYGVIEHVINFVEKHEQEFPDFVFIPHVSPSAVAQKTRKNELNHDINRCFFDPPMDEEVADTMAIIQQHHFSLSLNFHEDPDLKRTFYLYDTNQISAGDLSLLRNTIRATGALLHTGVDDPLDANLGLHVEEGYISTPYESMPKDAGFSWVWFDKHKLVDRSIDIEIPGGATAELKRALVDVTCSFFLSGRFS